MIIIIGTISGIIASTRTSVEYQYFTSVFYPIITSDQLSVASTPSLTTGNLWTTAIEDATVSVPTLRSGTLVESIVLKTYNEPLATENTSVSVPTLRSGTLVESIVLKTYNEPLATENTSVSVPTLRSGTLVVTINYVNYNEPLATENTSVSVPTLLSGTLS